MEIINGRTVNRMCRCALYETKVDETSENE